MIPIRRRRAVPNIDAEQLPDPRQSSTASGVQRLGESSCQGLPQPFPVIRGLGTFIGSTPSANIDRQQMTPVEVAICSPGLEIVKH
jgi:hypothetical protein